MMKTDNITNGSKSKEGTRKKRSRRKVSNKKKLQNKKTTFITINPPVVKNDEDHNVLVSLFTKQQQYAVPRSAISVPDNINPDGLNEMISTILKQSNFNGIPPQFNFLLDGVLLSGKLIHRFNSSDSTSREGGLEIEYMEQLPPPTPKDALNHDDWVSSVDYSHNNWLLTGCYDNTIHIWRPSVALVGKNSEKKLSDDKEAHKLKIPSAHRAPVKVVSWIPKSDMFVSGGMDQAVLVWHWCSTSNSVRCVYRCRGHAQSIESLAVAADGKLFSTGSWDGILKIWTTDDEGVTDWNAEGKEPSTKKSCTTSDPPKNKAPRVTLSDHSQSVSGLVWPTLRTMASCSWDNSVRLWDVEAQSKVSQYVAPCSCLALHSSPFNNTILVSTMDTHVRLLDPREKECLSLTKVYLHHKRWVNCVKWSPANEHHFATGGFDNIIKLWDTRGPRSPLFEMFSHNDKVLDLDWTSPGLLFSASADTNVKIFKL